MLSKEIKECIKLDKKIYFHSGDIEKDIFHKITQSNFYLIGKYIIYSRKAGFYKENRKSLINKLFCIYYMKRKNVLGRKLNIDLAPSFFGKNLIIWHGNIVVNYYAEIR